METIQFVNLSKFKEYFDVFFTEENVDDIKDGIEYMMKAKEKFFAVLCNVFDLDFGDESRGLPDELTARITEKMSGVIKEDPKLFFTAHD